MISLTIGEQTTFLAFWVSFSRWLAVLMQLPLFDNTVIPILVKILFSVLISYAFFPLVETVTVNELQFIGSENVWLAIMFHTSIGFIIGFLVKIIMTLFLAAGSILTQQIGFNSVSYFDPSQGQQVGPFERLIEWTLLVIIVFSGALRPMFEGVLHSFLSINMTNFTKILSTPQYFILFLKSTFKAAVLLAGPLIFANLLVNLVMGILARTVPQMNILMVSFVVNIGIGLLLFLGISEEFFHVSFNLYVEKLGLWFEFLKP